MRYRAALGATLLSVVVAGQAARADAYLPPEQVPDGVAVLPPPPRAGSAAAKADQVAFAATRGLAGSARWQIATEDVSNRPLDRYACALGLQLTLAEAPALARLLERIGTGELVDRVKQHYRTPRPYLGTAARICEARSAHLEASPDYPSGHAANGWLEALVLASLAPARATALLARGRAYGESRVVCGSHTVSAVEAGWMAGSVMFARLAAEPAFNRDLDAARQELAALGPRAARPEPQRCAAEQALLANRPW